MLHDDIERCLVIVVCIPTSGNLSLFKARFSYGNKCCRRRLGNSICWMIMFSLLELKRGITTSMQMQLPGVRARMPACLHRSLAHAALDAGVELSSTNELA